MPLYDADDAGKGAIRVMRINNTIIDVTAHNPALRIYNVVVDVLRPVKVVTSTGVAESTITLVSNLMCAIRWKSGSERILFDKITHYLDATLRCRRPAGVTLTTDDRIRHDSKDYEIVDIVDVNNLGRLLKMSIRKVE